MQWPGNPSVYPDSLFLFDLQQTIANNANTIAAFEPVVMLMGRAHQMGARQMLSEAVEFWNIPTDDLWCRDSGPLFAINPHGQTVVSGLRFNGWGNKQTYAEDDKVSKRVAEHLGFRICPSGLTGEPGGIECDGNGTLLAHESCWANPNRNTLSKSEIEHRLLASYGADKIIWAPGVSGCDITDDHIDALARFAQPARAVIQIAAPGDNDVFARSARTTLSILHKTQTAQENALEVVKLPSPTSQRIRDHDFLASYANYYVCNGAVVCAEFGDRETDAVAKDLISILYPDKEIIRLNVDPLAETGGGIHRAPQQQPLAF